MNHEICSLQQKPTYVNAFHWIAGLQATGQEESGSTTLSDINPNTISLLIWIWKHTNNQPGCPDFGKAWTSHAKLARAMHVSEKTVQRAFDDAWSWGLISREHVFKKNGKIIVSTTALTKQNKGLGEFQHTRYWLNWEFVRELQSNGVVTESSPIGVVRESSPNEIGVVTESRALVAESREVLIEGFIFSPTSTLDCDGTAPDETPSEAVSSVEAEAGTAHEMSECGKSSHQPTLKNGRADGRPYNICRSDSPIVSPSQQPVSDSPEKIGSSSSDRFGGKPFVESSREEEKATATQKKPKVEPADPSCVALEDLRTVWMQEQDSGLNRHGWKPTAENIGLREELRNAGLLNRKDFVLPAFRRFIHERCCEDEAPIHAPLAIFRDEFQVWVTVEAKDHQAERDWHHREELRRAEKVKRILAEDAEYLASAKR